MYLYSKSCRYDVPTDGHTKSMGPMLVGNSVSKYFKRRLTWQGGKSRVRIQSQQCQQEPKLQREGEVEPKARPEAHNSLASQSSLSSGTKFDLKQAWIVPSMRKYADSILKRLYIRVQLKSCPNLQQEEKTDWMRKEEIIIGNQEWDFEFHVHFHICCFHTNTMLVFWICCCLHASGCSKSNTKPDLALHIMSPPQSSSLWWTFVFYHLYQSIKLPGRQRICIC